MTGRLTSILYFEKRMGVPVVVLTLYKGQYFECTFKKFQTPFRVLYYLTGH